MKVNSITSTWDTAVNTLASMCVSYQLGKGPTKEAFISTLRIYADEMEKLIEQENKHE